eukprot:1140377-Pelagomonas_calceolata.AAC.5
MSESSSCVAMIVAPLHPAALKPLQIHSMCRRPVAASAARQIVRYKVQSTGYERHFRVENLKIICYCCQFSSFCLLLPLMFLYCQSTLLSFAPEKRIPLPPSLSLSTSSSSPLFFLFFASGKDLVDLAVFLNQLNSATWPKETKVPCIQQAADAVRVNLCRPHVHDPYRQARLLVCCRLTTSVLLSACMLPRMHIFLPAHTRCAAEKAGQAQSLERRVASILLLLPSVHLLMNMLRVNMAPEL